MKNIYLRLAEAHNQSLVLATVIKTEGSTPQKPGSSAIFSEKGLLIGTIGGGVVEGRVQAAAFEALRSKRSGYFTYDLSNDISRQEEAICGGQITVLLDANPANSIVTFGQLRDSIEQRIPGVLVSMVTAPGEESLMVDRYWMNSKIVPDIRSEFLEKISPVVQQQIKRGNSYDFREMTLSLSDEEPASLFLLEPVFPPDHLVIAGAGHIGRALAHMGNLLGFEVTVIDDRNEYANPLNIPDADHIIVKDIGVALFEMKKGADTYIVIVTRGHNDDAEALKPCLGSGLAYLGMIGSKRKVATMKHEFLEKGYATIEQWEKIYTPIGIEIGSQTVEEIAVSIAAQLVKVRSERS
ncbi:MAG TPA: XdhC/CoxI family protein [Bacteroidales bacterium]|nr:XdhC/CoxI family protein [Bacteroidales bacterium]